MREQILATLSSETYFYAPCQTNESIRSSDFEEDEGENLVEERPVEINLKNEKGQREMVQSHYCISAVLKCQA